MKTLNSYKHIEKVCGSHQVTAQELLNGRTHTAKGGWSKIKLNPEFEKQIIDDLLDIMGGTKDTYFRRLRALQNARPQHWWLQRAVVYSYNGINSKTKRRKRKIGLTYIAGQDQTWENREIRKYLTK